MARQMSSVLRELVRTVKAPLPMGNYSQAVIANGAIYVSGCVGMDKDTMKMVSGGAAEQAEMAIKNMIAILEAAGSSAENVVKTSIFVKDMKDYDAINEVYKKFFVKDVPARTFLQVDKLTLDALVTVESIASAGCLTASQACACSAKACG